MRKRGGDGDANEVLVWFYGSRVRHNCDLTADWSIRGATVEVLNMLKTSIVAPRAWQFSAMPLRSVVEAMRSRGDHGDVIAIYAAQAPLWHRIAYL